MVLDGVIFLVSLLALLYSSDRLIDSVVAISKRFHVSPMVIGLTVVAIGTSLPEAMASVVAALDDHPQIAVGNVIGSNICNVGLILGLPGLFYVISCDRAVLLREGSMMLAATAGLWMLFELSGGLTRLSGVLFLLGFAGFIIVAVVFGNDDETEDSDTEVALSRSALTIGLMLTGAIVVLLVSSKYLVAATVALAEDLQVPEKVISISMVAFGTSVPELSVSFVAARRRQGDILIGNILGSNISNILFVLGLTAVINPFTTTEVLGLAELPMMSILALLMIYFLSQKGGISGWKAGLLLTLYVAFIAGCALGFV